ncbi:MAG: FAD-dependent oxidoreductase [Methylotenera sp.]
MTNTSVVHADIAIVGAGLVGLAAAVGLQQAGFSVVLIDNKKPDQESKNNEPPTKSAAKNDDIWDTRIYAISPKNAEWLKSLGVWQLLNPMRIGEMRAMEIWGDAAAQPLQLSAEDANADYLGFIVEAKALMQALMLRVEALSVCTFFEHSCNTLKADPNKAKLQLANRQTPDTQKIIESALLVAADGSHSWVRQQLNIPVHQKPYDQIALVANFEVEKSHANIARQWFAQDAEGGHSILAWLPLPGNRISIVWSVSTQYAEVLLTLTDTEFTQQVTVAGDSILGELKLISSPAAFPLALQKADTLTQDCVVLVGDAAHQIHPMAGQGVNLGFRDVVDLIKMLTEKNQYQSVNDSRLLKHYSRVRKADTLNMLMLTDGLCRLFESQHYAIKKLRNWGLSAANQQSIKKMLVAKAMTL